MTIEARRSLARRFDLPYADDMQDWEWEVADAERFDEFLLAYETADLSDDERFSLMEVLVHCVEDVANTDRFDTGWAAIEPWLRSRRLHRSTIEYWACLDESHPDALFYVSARMRELTDARERF